MTVPEKKQMNAGVALLLERMKTNPEEFLTQEKWSHLIQSHKMFLSDEDRNALENALNGLMQQRFTEKVLEELVDPKKSNWVDEIMQQKGITSAGTTPGQYITLETAEHMKAHIEALRVKNRDELINKKPTTVFGKLFNYS